MSTLINDNFDCLSDDLFSDGECDVNLVNIEDENSDSSEDEERGKYMEKRYDEKKKLLDIYMNDPSIPESKKTLKDFQMSLYEPNYERQQLYELRKALLAQKATTAKKEKKRKSSKHKKTGQFVEGFGYEDTFFAPTEEILAQQKRIDEMPPKIKEIYNTKGIVNASQIYRIEQELNCDNENQPKTVKKRNELSQSLLELSITMSEQFEVEQVIKDLENIDPLNESLQELSEKLQTSAKAAELIDYTITSSQKLKILHEINTCDYAINTCDVLDFEDEKEPDNGDDLVLTQRLIEDEQMEKVPSDINSNIENFNHVNQNIIPTDVGFSFASGKKIALSSSKISKFKSIFETGEKSINMPSHQQEINCIEPAAMQNAFTFASGKSVKIDTSKIEAFQKRFQEEEAKLASPEKGTEAKTSQCQNNESLSRNANSGILINTQTGRRKSSKETKSLFQRKPKKVQFDESSLTKSDSTSVSIENEPIPQEVGFSFASGKSIKISNVAMEKFKNIFENKEREVTETTNQPIEEVTPKIEEKLPSCSTACSSPHEIKRSEQNEHVKAHVKQQPPKSQMRKNEDNINSDTQLLVNTQDLNQIEQIEKSHETSNPETPKKSRKLDPEFDPNEFIIISPSPPRKIQSRKTSKMKLTRMNESKKDEVEEDCFSKFQRMMHNMSVPIAENNSQDENNFNLKPTNCGFTFASGKNVQLNISKVISFKRKFEDKDESFSRHETSSQMSDNSFSSKKLKLNESKATSSPSEHKSSPKVSGDSGFSLNSYRTNALLAKQTQEDDSDFTFTTTRASRKSSQIAAKTKDSGIESQDSKKSPAKQMLSKSFPFFTPSFTSSPVVMPSTSRIQKVSEAKNENITAKRKPAEFDDDDDDYIIPFKPIVVKKLALQNDLLISPINRPNQRPKRLMKKEPLRLLFDGKTTSQRMREADEIMAYHSQLRLLGNDPTASQLESILEIENEQTSKYEKEQKLKNDREEAMKEQLEYIANKPEEDSRQTSGTMYMMKSGGGRKQLKDYAEDGQSKWKGVHLITQENIMEYRFDMKLFAENVDTKVSIFVGDNAKLIMDEASTVGFEEIKSSFLASYGVDPKLISNLWVENAYKIIFMKLMWMENCIEKIDKFEVLTPENLVLQLKYRYDREIDRHQRPALRKITEKDESPNRRIILKVIDVIYTRENGYELELSDGWYKIRTCIDSILAEAVAKKKIHLNAKLAISGGELVNIFDAAYHPLELPKGVRFKIHGNSTRIARWDQKLGFTKNPSPLLLSLNAVSHDGGGIGRLRLFIAHVYSMIYVESNGEKKEFRSEKMQTRLENKKEILYSTMYEKIYNQILQESHKELKERISKIDRNRINIDKMSIHEICDLLEYENDSDLAYMIKAQLTMLQKERIYDIYNERKAEVNQRVKDRISKNENSVAQLLKFRVVDAKNPKKTALISWWQPAEDLLNTIKVGKFIEFRKMTSGGKSSAIFTGELQIHADNQTSVKELKMDCDTEKFQKFIRGETRFSYISRNFRPLNDEFDIACMIVFVEDPQPNSKFQKVYVTNERMEFIVINFYPNITESALEDVLIEGKFLYIRNLQWRRSFKDNIDELPEAYSVIDSTIFVNNPREETPKRRLEEIASSIGDPVEYLKKCCEKLIHFGVNYTCKKKDEILKTIQLNFPSAVSPKSRSKKRFLGLRKGPIRYRFS